MCLSSCAQQSDPYGQGSSQAARLMQGSVDAGQQSGNDLFRQRRAARNAAEGF